MEKQNDTLNPHQSLDLIASMIQQAKGNVQKSSFYFLLWGWTIVIANLGVYILIKFTDVKNPFIMFAITIPMAVVAVIYNNRQNKTEVVSTHLDKIHKWLWAGFGLNCALIVFVGKFIGWMVNPMIVLMCALPTFITGVMLKFRPLMLGGLVFWIAGTVLFFLRVEEQFLVAALAISLGYLVPGYMLRKSEK
ncbi:MAG TPA: hypothetical protein PK325_09080 [Cyclobacteriaceae bacterium]|nr:hypothetical protein [Cyclobacteriaceae bacterium]HMV09958.1 hypothetical protein [Cyclobacteriaceae bacterium]HMV90796.1 hypothetical protein [Cyclobacteriaceae bacterium]HMX01603.1 hypothetical protein [Cyclobacteriaceae bacterium]HMX50703.1 hypothetical protein [Cyclobacteriaceae bacterium]